MTFNTTSPLAGIDLNNSTPTTAMQTNSAGTAIPPHKLGTRVLGTNSSEWVYVQAAGAVTAGDAVTVTTSGTATRATTANVIAGQQIAFAQNAFADTDYGWVALNGNALTVNVSGTTAVDIPLYIGTSGKLTYVTASATVAGVGLTYASTLVSVQAIPAFVSWPRCPLANG